MRRILRIPLISVFIAFLMLDLSLLYPLEVCFLTGQDPDFGDIIGAVLDADDGLADVVIYAHNPHQAIISAEIRAWPDFPDMEKVLPEDSYCWTAPTQAPSQLVAERYHAQIKLNVVDLSTRAPPAV